MTKTIFVGVYLPPLSGTSIELQIISVEELNEMLEYADAAYSYVIEHRDTEAWAKELGKTSACLSAGVKATNSAALCPSSADKE